MLAQLKRLIFSARNSRYFHLPSPDQSSEDSSTAQLFLRRRDGFADFSVVVAPRRMCPTATGNLGRQVLWKGKFLTFEMWNQTTDIWASSTNSLKAHFRAVIQGELLCFCFLFADCPGTRPFPVMPNENFDIFGALGVAIPHHTQYETTVLLENYYRHLCVAFFMWADFWLTYVAEKKETALK